MSTEFRPSTEQDLPKIVALMQAAFDAPRDAPFLNLDLLRWKYFEPNRAWPTAPRSYVLDQDGKLLSHGCAWPVAPNIACLIDWVSAKSIPGMGMMLARKIAELSPVLLSIGGSQTTQKIMPKIGFAKRGELLTYARVLRPWRQFRTRPDNHGPRSILRLARNVAWSLGPVALSNGWSATSAAGPPFMMRCPGARLTAYKLPVGSLLLSRVGGQARIAALTVHSPAAYAAAIEAARRDPEEVCELIALAHDGATRRALLENGFEERMRRSVFVSDPAHTLRPADFPLRLNMLADDLFYLHTPEHPFLT